MPTQPQRTELVSLSALGAFLYRLPQPLLPTPLQGRHRRASKLLEIRKSILRVGGARVSGMRSHRVTNARALVCTLHFTHRVMEALGGEVTQSHMAHWRACWG